MYRTVNDLFNRTYIWGNNFCIMKKLLFLFSALLALTACSSPEELYLEAEEISNVEAGETLIEYQQKYIKIAEEALKLDDKEFAKFIEHDNGFSQGCVIKHGDSWGWQLSWGWMELPDCFNLCRDEDRSLANDITEAYVQTAKALQAKYEDASIHEPKVMTPNNNYATTKREYIGTELGTCEYECELALAEIYIEWLEVFGELLEHDDFDRFRVDVVENVDDAMNGNGFWGSDEVKELRDKKSKIKDKVDENTETIYKLNREIYQRARML